jgi:hypothetical protein
VHHAKCLSTETYKEAPEPGSRPEKVPEGFWASLQDSDLTQLSSRGVVLAFDPHCNTWSSIQLIGGRLRVPSPLEQRGFFRPGWMSSTEFGSLVHNAFDSYFSRPYIPQDFNQFEIRMPAIVHDEVFFRDEFPNKLTDIESLRPQSLHYRRAADEGMEYREWLDYLERAMLNVLGLPPDAISRD